MLTELDPYLSGLAPHPIVYPEPPTVPFQIGATVHAYDEMEPLTIMFRVHYTDTNEYEYLVKTGAGQYKWVSHFNLYN